MNNSILLEAKKGLALYEVPVSRKVGKKVIRQKRYIAKCKNGCIYTLGKSLTQAKRKFGKIDSEILSSLDSGASGIVRKVKRSFKEITDKIPSATKKKKPASKKKTTQKKKAKRK